MAAYVAETGQRLFVKDILGVNCAQPLTHSLLEILPKNAF